MELGPRTRVLVTGASRGIGAALADAFEARGCMVGRVSRSGELAAATWVTASRSGAPSRASARSTCWWPTPASRTTCPSREMPLDLIEELTGVNWLGTAYTVKAALPGMLERGRGHIVIVSSGAGCAPSRARRSTAPPRRPSAASARRCATS